MEDDGKSKIDDVDKNQGQNPIDESLKNDLLKGISNASDDIKQKVLDSLAKDLKTPEPVVKEPSVDVGSIEARVREQVLSEMRAKMEEEAKAAEAAKVKDSLNSLSEKLESLESQLQTPKPLGQEQVIKNPFDSKGKKFEELTPKDVEAIDRATRVAFEKERLK